MAIGASVGAVVVVLHDDSLLASIAASEEDDHLPRLHDSIRHLRPLLATLGDRLRAAKSYAAAEANLPLETSPFQPSWEVEGLHGTTERKEAAERRAIVLRQNGSSANCCRQANCPVSPFPYTKGK